MEVVMDEDHPKRVDEDEWSAIVGVGAQRASRLLCGVKNWVHTCTGRAGLPSNAGSSAWLWLSPAVAGCQGKHQLHQRSPTLAPTVTICS